MRRLALGSCFLALLAVACTGRSPDAPDGSGLPAGVVCEWAAVVRVVDGDTIRVRIDGSEERVRYIGIDAPELSHPTLGVEPFGPEAAAYNEQLVGRRRVCLERDVSDRDRFGRLLRYAWLEDGTMVNELLIAAGMARVVTFPPDVKYIEGRLLSAQRTAADTRRGIWSP